VRGTTVNRQGPACPRPDLHMTDSRRLSVGGPQLLVLRHPAPINPVVHLPHATWRVDADVSELTFSSRGMFGLVPVRGTFGDYEGELEQTGNNPRQSGSPGLDRPRSRVSPSGPSPPFASS
jgi:hypothetical protein